MLCELEYLHIPPSHMLCINPKNMNPTDLRAWLFITFTLCKDSEAYNELNVKVNSSFECVQSYLHSDGLGLGTIIFQQREN